MALMLLGLLLLGGCQPQNLRPDATASETTATNTQELREKAVQAYNKGDWETAERAYVQLTEQVPKEADSWFRLGNIYARQGRPADAIAAYQETLVRKPKHAKAWHNMGIVQLRQASNSFMYLEDVTEPDDPLHERATLLLDTMTQLLESDFGGTATAPPAEAAAN
ncbi:tetratricopeptide (TPR) repeat protein [Methylohalomonas lacus]|uniref:Tetratricopeptide (TPR) repeat protein n=2 Tax=Methylohalomonas lacus TaxID=398773 RepID=A0AAE3HKQ9_9GAMM|nr:tetratricopeptide (TPR) repeat protein [Methylohalomonas lacus]